MSTLKVRSKTKTEALQDIVHDYIAEGQPWPASRRDIAAWAVRNRRYDAPQKSLIDRCAQELAAAMRREMETDPQGRTVRAKHCAKIKEMDENGNYIQKTLWFDRSAKPDLMHISFQQRRKAILGDNRQLKVDHDSYNDNNDYGAHIQLSFNYEDDLLEAEHDSEYNPDLSNDDGVDEND